PVGQRAVALPRYVPPRAEVDLVDGDGGRQAVGSLAAGQPAVVVPGVVQRPDDGGGLGRHLPPEGRGGGLVHAGAVVAGDDVVLVVGPPADARDEAFPDARVGARLQRLLGRGPAVEVAHDVDLLGAGGPYGEVGAGDAVHDARVGPELVVKAGVAA